MKQKIFLSTFLAIPIIFGIASFYIFSGDYTIVTQEQEKVEQAAVADIRKPEKIKVKPAVVKAAYVTMGTALNRKEMERLVDLARYTELNALVIDVKGSQGEMLFDYTDVPALVGSLHKEDIYLIARVVTFQDSGAAEDITGSVIKSKDGGVWRDRHRFAWIDPADKAGRERVISSIKRAIDAGFDEINFDYIRFPTDGNLENMVYPTWDGITPKYEVIKNFAAAMRKELKEYDPDIALSIDIFGYTFLTNDDLGIGQRLGDMLEEFDFVYPMVYPSHYSAGNFGFQNPAEHPYEVIKGTIEKGLEQLGDKSELVKPKIRPWLQVFDLGAEYTPDMIKLEKKAVYDGLGDKSTGWLLWDPGNDYDRAEEYLTQ